MSSKIRSRIGDLRYQVTIQSREHTRDTRGGMVEVWSDVATVWAAVEPIAGREAWQAAQAQAQTTHIVTIRAYDGLTARHRLIHDGRTLNIESVKDLEERGRYMELMCKEES